jgi:hypothetical protein
MSSLLPTSVYSVITVGVTVMALLRVLWKQTHLQQALAVAVTVFIAAFQRAKPVKSNK